MQRRAVAGPRTARTLAAQLSAHFVAFVVLQADGQPLLTGSYSERCAVLQSLFADHVLTAPWTLCPMMLLVGAAAVAHQDQGHEIAPEAGDQRTPRTSPTVKSRSTMPFDEDSAVSGGVEQVEQVVAAEAVGRHRPGGRAAGAAQPCSSARAFSSCATATVPVPGKPALSHAP